MRRRTHLPFDPPDPAHDTLGGVRGSLHIICSCLVIALFPWSGQADEIQLQSFDRVWTLVGESYPDPAMEGVDWERVRLQLRPLAMEACTNAELRDVLDLAAAFPALAGDPEDQFAALLEDVIDDAPGDAVPIRFGDGQGGRHDVSLPRQDAAHRVEALGHVDAGGALLWQQRIIGDVGYLRFDRFKLPVPELFVAALQRFEQHDVQGMVLDLRPNIGGFGGMPANLAGYLVADPDAVLGPDVLRISRTPSERDLVLFYAELDRRRAGTTLVTMGRQQVADRNCWHVLMTHADGDTVGYFFDPDSHALLAKEFHRRGDHYWVFFHEIRFDSPDFPALAVPPDLLELLPPEKPAP